jgi:hypothetical protein
VEAVAVRSLLLCISPLHQKEEEEKREEKERMS